MKTTKPQCVIKNKPRRRRREESQNSPINWKRHLRNLNRVIDDIDDITDEAQIIPQLKAEIRMYAESYMETDGKIHSKGALITIGCLKGCLQMMLLRKAHNEVRAAGAFGKLVNP